MHDAGVPHAALLTTTLAIALTSLTLVGACAGMVAAGLEYFRWCLFTQYASLSVAKGGDAVEQALGVQGLVLVGMAGTFGIVVSIPCVMLLVMSWRTWAVGNNRNSIAGYRRGRVLRKPGPFWAMMFVCNRVVDAGVMLTSQTLVAVAYAECALLGKQGTMWKVWRTSTMVNAALMVIRLEPAHDGRRAACVGPLFVAILIVRLYFAGRFYESILDRFEHACAVASLLGMTTLSPER